MLAIRKQRNDDDDERGEAEAAEYHVGKRPKGNLSIFLS